MEREPSPLSMADTERDGQTPYPGHLGINFRDQELMERPSALWDQPQTSEMVRDDDIDDRANLPWE